MFLLSGESNLLISSLLSPLDSIDLSVLILALNFPAVLFEPLLYLLSSFPFYSWYSPEFRCSTTPPCRTERDVFRAPSCLKGDDQFSSPDVPFSSSTD